MTVTRAPIIEEISIDSEPWERWLTDVSTTLEAPNRDAGTFTPVFTSLTIVGTVAITGNFVRKGELLFFDVVIDPATGVDSSASTLGTTSFELPSLNVEQGSTVKITASGFGTVNGFDVETPLDLGMGYVNISTLTVFTPTWSATDKKISITGWVRIEGL